ncbi:MAG: protein kinase domain-containing protein [Gemmatimonadales bacterium]
MLRCPSCGSQFAAPARFCQHDGAPLLGGTSRSPVPVTRRGTLTRTIVRPAREPADEAATLTNTVLDSRYEIMRRLGEGGMSYVYLGRELATGDEFAIKVLSPRLSRDRTSAARLRREAGLAMRLDHPNVCTILRLGETERGLIYVVMPCLEGELLSEREVKRGPWPLAEGLPLLIQLCHGLQHAHEQQVIHRDLKPENVMIVLDAPAGLERAVVMDFGLAKERQAGPELVKLTRTGIVLGTPEFLSPEQIRGRPLDGRSDIFALGILAFELFTGRLPFDGTTAQDMMIARLKGDARLLREFRPDLPDDLEAILARSLAKDPADRFHSMARFAEALAAVDLHTGSGARFFRP